jgi:hypothetical protein
MDYDEKIIESNESLPEGLIRFCESYDKNHPNKVSSMNHNLYLLQTIDRDGNITGEAYGMNLMTDTGFNQAYKAGVSASSENIYIGDGTDTPVVTNNALYSPIITTGSTKVSSSTSTYGMTYDSTTGIISQRQKMYEGYFDYNISGITEEKTITEIGYGLAYNNLQTHTLIYDKNGEVSSIVKRLNERLTITMFWTICTKKDWIVDAYDRGVYMAFRLGSFLDRDIPAFQPYVFYLPNHTNDSTRYGDGYMTIFGNDTNNTLSDNVMTTQASIGTRFIDGARQYVSNIVLLKGDTSYWNERCLTYNSLFLLFTKVKLSDPEEIVCEYTYTNSRASSFITNIFGNYTSDTANSIYGLIPAVDFDIQSLSMYNHLTHEWDITEQFVNNPDADYNTNFIGYVRIFMNIPFLKTSTSVYVFINPRNDIPITSFSNSGITVYATDEYWNPDSWQIISNLSAVDESLQTKRYYVTLDYLSSDFLYATRKQTYHQIITKNATIDPDTQKVIDESKTLKFNIQSNSNYIHCKGISNDEYGYIVTSNYIVYPDSSDADGNPYMYKITSANGNYPDQYLRWQFTKGDKIALCDNSSTYINRRLRVYTLSSDPSIAPIAEDLDIAIVETNNREACYWSSSQNGFVIFQSRFDGNKAIIVDLYGGDDDNTVTQYQIDGVRHCHALDLTNNCVYLTDDTSLIRFEIYDMKEQTVIDSFSLPDTSYTVDGIGGWKDYVYIRVSVSGSYSTFLYYVETKNLVHLPNLNLPMLTSGDYCKTYHQQYCVDECMVIGGERYDSSSDLYDIKVFTAQNPEEPINLFSSGIVCLLRQYLNGGQLKYMNDGKQLIFAINSYNREIAVDIGHVIDYGPIDRLPQYNFWYNDRYRNSDYATIGLYKESCWLTTVNNLESGVYYSYTYMNPIELYLPHKIVGTTYTINSYNNPKRIGSKTYTFRVTNDTSKWEVSSE